MRVNRCVDSAHLSAFATPNFLLRIVAASSFFPRVLSANANANAVCSRGIIVGKVGTGVDHGATGVAKRRREVVGRVTVASDTTS
jgi:hypothetical protein